jgi:hypothetical protein
MHILFETDELRLQSDYEKAFLINKSTDAILLEHDFYDDPNCGLIDKNNKWAIIAGKYLTIWTPQKCKRIGAKNIQWIHSLRVRNSEIVEILTDPWSSNSAIWEINIKTFEFKKLRPFNDYKKQEYSENVNW